MRSYKQYCAIAKALDVVGDRWNLLIVRELLLQRACRYTDLQNGLPGIATNLLAERLRELEREGIVAREEAPPPIAATLFRLTPRGQQLDATLFELGRWGAPLMTEPDEHDAFRGRWLAFPISFLVSDRTPDQPPVTIELRTGGDTITVETGDGKVHTPRPHSHRTAATPPRRPDRPAEPHHRARPRRASTRKRRDPLAVPAGAGRDRNPSSCPVTRDAPRSVCAGLR